MTIENLTPVLLVVAGFALFVCGLIWRNDLRSPLDLGWNKLGFTFKADTLAFVLLLGAGLMISGAALWNRGYETKLASKDEQIKALSERMQGMEDLFSQFKKVNLSLHLVFPAKDVPDDLKNTTITALVIRKGDIAPKLYDRILADKGDGGIIVELLKVSPGDRVRIIAENSDKTKTWRSMRIKIPAGYVNMTRSPAP